MNIGLARCCNKSGKFFKEYLKNGFSIIYLETSTAYSKDFVSHTSLHTMSVSNSGLYSLTFVFLYQKMISFHV